MQIHFLPLVNNTISGKIQKFDQASSLCNLSKDLLVYPSIVTFCHNLIPFKKYLCVLVHTALPLDKENMQLGEKVCVYYNISMLLFHLDYFKPLFCDSHLLFFFGANCAYSSFIVYLFALPNQSLVDQHELH